MKAFLTTFIFTSLFIWFAPVQAQEGHTIGEILLKGIGGKEKWENTNYILFTARGNSLGSIQNDRKFLINTTSGQARFEGISDNGDLLVALFNYKTDQLSAFSVNGDTSKETDTETRRSFARVCTQFKKDIAFLFLPALIERPRAIVGKAVPKIFNAEKLLALHFQLPSGFSGEVLFNEETGRIKQVIDAEGNKYVVEDYKDIGGGLFLPTTFKNLENSTKSIVFSTVAAFTEMEESKFSIL